MTDKARKTTRIIFIILSFLWIAILYFLSIKLRIFATSGSFHGVAILASISTLLDWAKLKKWQKIGAIVWLILAILSTVLVFLMPRFSLDTRGILINLNFSVSILFIICIWIFPSFFKWNRNKFEWKRIEK